MKKSLATIIAALSAVSGAFAAEAPLWLRNTAISPDGATIAFTYRGDIFTVSVGGGEARQLSSDPAYDTAPVWSPDGSRIAFASDRMGSTDIYVVAAGGGTPVRLTTHSGTEMPLAWLNDSTVLFRAALHPSHHALNDAFFQQTYAVKAVPGSRPVPYLSLHMESADVAPDGAVIFEEHKSYENKWRKHECSAGTPDIQMYKDGRFTRLTDFKGSDRNPVWLGDGRFAYLSEEDGTLNVYSRTAGSAAKTQLTSFKDYPVRSLSASADGKVLAFSWDGEIYTLRPGAAPEKVAVDIKADKYDADHVRRIVSSGASTMAVSPSGEEVAFTLRGDIYVTSVEYKTTKRISPSALFRPPQSGAGAHSGVLARRSHAGVRLRTRRPVAALHRQD